MNKWHNYPEEEPPYNIKVFAIIKGFVKVVILTKKTAKKISKWRFFQKPPYWQ